MKIFVCYTTRDPDVKISFLKKFLSLLLPYGTPYIDLLHNDSIDKQSRVERELSSSDCVVLIRSDSVGASPWVIRELEMARTLKIQTKQVLFNTSFSKIEKEVGEIMQTFSICNPK